MEIFAESCYTIAIGECTEKYKSIAIIDLGYLVNLFKVRHTPEMTLGQVITKYGGNTNFKSKNYQKHF